MSADTKTAAAYPIPYLRAHLSRRLKVLMAERGWRQVKLAHEAGMGRDNVGGYVNGRNLPGDKHLAALASAFGVPVTDLMPSGLTSFLPRQTGRALQIEHLETVMLPSGRMRVTFSQELSTLEAAQVLAIVAAARAQKPSARADA